MMTERKFYESPQLEVVEIAIEQAILSNSVPDFEDGGDMFN